MKNKINARTLIAFSDLIKQFYDNKADELAKLNLKTIHCKFLHLLSDHEGISQQEIANIALVKRSTISELITEMAAENLIERVPSNIDKRVIHVYLTAHGKEKVKAIRHCFDDYSTQCTQDFNEEELRQFESLLKKFKFPNKNTSR